LDWDIFAALRSFVHHAPLAKLLAEAEGWKLATALHAICHEDLAPAGRDFTEGRGASGRRLSCEKRLAGAANSLCPYKM
jgi:hypothetical protein